MKRQLLNVFFVWLAIILLVPTTVKAVDSDWGYASVYEDETTTLYMSSTFQSIMDNPYTINITYNWSSYDKSIAQITSSSLKSCTVKGLKKGTVRINCYLSYVTDMGYGAGVPNSVNGYIMLTVKEKVPVTSISLSPSEVCLTPGGNKQLTATISPNNAYDKTVTWSSSDIAVVTVDNTGMLKAMGYGDATITCSANDGSSKQATCEVKVTDVIVVPKSVSAGYGHTMILKTDSTLWACGNNDDGRLGDGTTTSCSTPVHVMNSVASVSAGYNHTMILKTDGTLWACGSNDHGQLGDGTETSRHTPIQVMTDVAAVSAGGYYTMMLKKDGSLWACGNDNEGQAGGHYSHTPIQVMTDVAAVSAGGFHTMILKKDGSLWACGRNSSGQLGDGTGTNRHTPIQVMTDVAAVSAGESHTMILKTDGTLWACGRNSSGQLGDGTTTYYRTPIQVMNDVAAVSAAADHTMILKTDGTLWACGGNKYGQLGDGTTTDRHIPVQVMNSVAAISAGGHHTMYLKTNGSLWACGGNGVGQLGDGTKNERHIPVQISDGDVGNYHFSILLPITASVYIGETKTLTPTIIPAGVCTTLTWATDDPTIAEVTQQGVIMGIKEGIAIVRVTTDNGLAAECFVAVSTIPEPDEIVLPSEATVVAGQTITLTPSITPANAEYILTWSSDDETVATVSQDGVVTGLKKGKTFINVETNNGKTGYCKLTVKAPEPISISLPKNANVYVGRTLTLTPSITPKDAETALTWSSDDETVVRVSSEGVLTGVAEGLALVTVSTSNGLKSNLCKVTVETDPEVIDAITPAYFNGTKYPIYNLSGQRLEKPRKGVNIVGGKKVLVK